jgi:hypothetical protein
MAAAATILGIFTVFAGDGLFAYFTPDDMMNLYDSWFRPLIETDRYLGTLIYRSLFASFGLNPLPYRVVCMALLLVNLGLLYRFCERLSGSREIGALACLLGAYHAHLADLYYSTGTIYDLLCAALYLGAFLIVARPGDPSWKRIAAFALLYATALNAKEMAITLPAVVLGYRLLYQRPLNLLREARILAPATLIGAAFLLYKIAGPRHMMDNSAYRPTFTWATYIDNWQHYTFDLFYGRIAFTPLRIVAMWAILLAIAGLLRRRVLLFAILLVFVTMLPVAFIPQRGFFAIYLTLPGWYLFFAAVVTYARDAIVLPRPQLQIATFAAFALLLIPLHARQKPIGRQWVEGAQETVHSVAANLHDIAGPLRHGARILFISDPYPKDEWMLTFIFRLYYRDIDMQIDRVRAMRTPPDESTYDHLFSTDGHTLARVR